MKTRLQDVRIIDIPKIVDPKGRGKLSDYYRDYSEFQKSKIN